MNTSIKTERRHQFHTVQLRHRYVKSIYSFGISVIEFKLFLFIFLNACESKSYRTQSDNRGQPKGVLSSHHKPRGSKPRHEVWWQVCLFTEPSCQASISWCRTNLNVRDSPPPKKNLRTQFIIFPLRAKDNILCLKENIERDKIIVAAAFSSVLFVIKYKTTTLFLNLWFFFSF